ncbi:MAG: hypothetical protein BMS9Abin25_0159 [Gammaproteobacteria bacterium]|nr:MAG: hypothetical protein BMS9Abin25_0159 [Gammaproteobacteria bacterium]
MSVRKNQSPFIFVDRIGSIPLWVKFCYTGFVVVLVPTYWWQYGPANFMWASNLALLITLLGLWLESSLLVSMMALSVLIPELVWAVDFAVRLVAGSEVVSFRGTRYMFDPGIPLLVRGLSLYHLALPIFLLWAIHRLGYHRKALMCQTLLSWIVLPLSYLVSKPDANINWVFGFIDPPQQWLPAVAFVLFLMVLYPLVLFLPTHLLLRRVFR